MTRRIRQVRREFWSDSVAGKWPDDLRLFYIGLWCEADDDGFVALDLEDIAADLYRYRSATTRLRSVERWLAALIASGRVVVMDCGRHARIPTLPVHQVIGGRHNYEVRDEHQRTCGTPPPERSVVDHDRPGSATAVGMVGNGKERNGMVPPAADRASTTAAGGGFDAAMRAHGFDPTAIGRGGLTSRRRSGTVPPSDDTPTGGSTP